MKTNYDYKKINGKTTVYENKTELKQGIFSSDDHVLTKENRRNLSRVLFASVLLSILLVFPTCEYEDEPGSEDSSGERLASISASGLIEVDSEICTYNEEGLLTSVIKNSDADNTVVINYQYDSKDRLITVQQINANGDSQIETIEYDSSDNKIRTETKDLYNIIDHIVQYYYDDENRLIKKEVKAPSGAVIGSASFVYEDKKVKGFGEERSKLILMQQ